MGWRLANNDRIIVNVLRGWSVSGGHPGTLLLIRILDAIARNSNNMKSHCYMAK